MASPTMTLIQSVTVPSGGASSIDFTSIPSTYTDLCLVVSLRGTYSAATGTIQNYLSINGSNANRTIKRIEAYSTSVVSDSAATYTMGYIPGTAVTASTFNNTAIYITNYASTTLNKSISCDAVVERNSATDYDLELIANLWSSTVAINQLTITPSLGNLDQYSTAYLYGIRNS